LEKLSGKVWEDLMRDRIFVPLGITSGGFGAPGDGKAVDQPRGHRGGVPVTPGASADNPAAIGPAGTVHMRIGDWAKFVAAHANGERAEKPTLLKKETYATLHAPWREKGDEREGYAGGWTITKRAWAKGAGKDDWGRVFTHAGSNTMWYCVTWVAPERDFAVVVACNQGGDSAKACDEVAASLVSLAREK
jgi:CubicO group peptidase (beta-lactamase class C family)